MDSHKEKDKWDKVGIILQPMGGLLTALAVAGLGFIGSSYLKNREVAEIGARERAQAVETNVRLYTELISRREEAESALRKDMFNSIISSFLTPGPDSPEKQVLNLELLAYNFHESLDLKPLFAHLKKQLGDPQNPAQREYSERLNKVAGEITRKQLLILEGAGKKFDRTIDLDTLSKTPGGIPLDEATLMVDNVKRDFQIFVLEADPKTKEIKVRLDIRTPKDSGETVESNVAEFWVGFFDFPMIDNTRLSHDQRCAIILTAFGKASADVTTVYFPGSYAGVREKPYYQEVIQNLLESSQLIGDGKLGKTK